MFLLMYKIYQTDGIVLSTENVREADVFYFIYTREFGLINATATGVRLLKSKLRFSLQAGSLVELGFVKGKSIFRITHAKEILSQDTFAKKYLCAKLFGRVKRMIKGEEKEDSLYELILDVFNFIKNEKDIDEKKEYTIELLFTVKLLFILGYWSKETGEFYIDSVLDEPSLQEVFKNRKHLINKINIGLELSQL
jgi:DNA repair protein RecO